MCVQTSIFLNVGCQIKHISNFQPLEVVDRDSETQLQVAENFNYLFHHVHS